MKSKLWSIFVRAVKRLPVLVAIILIANVVFGVGYALASPYVHDSFPGGGGWSDSGWRWQWRGRDEYLVLGSIEVDVLGTIEAYWEQEQENDDVPPCGPQLNEEADVSAAGRTHLFYDHQHADGFHQAKLMEIQVGRGEYEFVSEWAGGWTDDSSCRGNGSYLIRVRYRFIPNPPTETPTLTATPTPTATATSSPSPTPTVTETPTEVPTETPTLTPTSTSTATPTPTLTATATPANTPTPTPTSTATSTPTVPPTPTWTPTATPTATPTVVPFFCKRLDRIKVVDLGDKVRVHYRGYPSDGSRTAEWKAEVDGWGGSGSWSGEEYIDFFVNLLKGRTYTTVFSVLENIQDAQWKTSPACQNHVTTEEPPEEPPPVEPPPPSTTIQVWVDGEGPGDTGEVPYRGWPNRTAPDGSISPVTVEDVLAVYGTFPPDLFRDEGNGVGKVELRFGTITVEEVLGKSTSTCRIIRVTNFREDFRVPYVALSKGRLILELKGSDVGWVQWGEHGDFHVFGIPQSWSYWNERTGKYDYDKADRNLTRHWGGRWSDVRDPHSGREDKVISDRVRDYAMIIQLALAKDGFGFQDDPVQQWMAALRGKHSLWQYPKEPFKDLAPWAEQAFATLLGRELQYIPGWTPKWIEIAEDGTVTDLRTVDDVIRGFETLPPHPEPGVSWVDSGLPSEWGWEWESTKSFCPGGGDWCE